jgi:hypothetical protein
LVIEGVESPKTPSYEHRPFGRSKTVRTAVGRSIFPADGTGRTSKPAASEGKPAGPDKSERKTHRVEAAVLPALHSPNGSVA